MPPPFNIPTTSPAPSDLISAYPANEQANRAEIEDWLSYISDPTTGAIRLSVLPAGVVAFAAGTAMIFRQTAAPTGWTKDTTHNDKALRIVSGTAGTGGTKAFSAVMKAALDTSTYALTAADIPAHTHTFSGNTGTESADHVHSGTYTGSAAYNGDHAHTWYWSSTTSGSGGPTGNGTAGGYAASTSTNGGHTHSVTVSGTSGGRSAAHTHAYSGTTSSVGSGGGHKHTVDLDVNYVDVIIATKDA